MLIYNSVYFNLHNILCYLYIFIMNKDLELKKFIYILKKVFDLNCIVMYDVRKKIMSIFIIICYVGKQT